MGEQRLGQKPTFSAASDNSYEPGMSQRLFIATMAMKGILSNSHMTTGLSNKDGLAKASYEIADELLKQENG